jgi:heme/copper-type cytochrome/quinol oxidase subunit 4
MLYKIIKYIFGLEVLVLIFCLLYFIFMINSDEKNERFAELLLAFITTLIMITGFIGSKIEK